MPLTSRIACFVVCFQLAVSELSATVDITRFFDIFQSMPAATTTRTERSIELFHALSDETRLEIVELLRGGERCVCELTDTLDAAQSRLSFHLRVLKDAGIVRDRKDGRWVHYELEPEAFEEIESLVSAMKPRAVRSSKACCA
jgi:ArsR family transcriptional regulator, arsenate/arsenite/antimonite-responsive transcriptional repressor